MDLAALRTEVRRLVSERSSDKGLIPDVAALDGWINRANRQVYRKACEWSVAPFVARTGELPYAGGGVAYSAIVAAPAVVRQVVLVKVKRGADFYRVEPYEAGYLDHASLEPAPETAAGIRWYVEGEKLLLTPEPAVVPTLRVHYLPEARDLTDANPAPLNGRVADAHDLIALVAAQLLFRKDEFQRTPWDQDVGDGYNDLRRALARSQGQRTRRIRRASHY